MPPTMVQFSLQAEQRQCGQTPVTTYHEQKLLGLVKEPSQCMQRDSLLTEDAIITAYHRYITQQMVTSGDISTHQSP